MILRLNNLGKTKTTSTRNITRGPGDPYLLRAFSIHAMLFQTLLMASDVKRRKSCLLRAYSQTWQTNALLVWAVARILTV